MRTDGDAKLLHVFHYAPTTSDEKFPASRNAVQLVPGARTTCEVTLQAVNSRRQLARLYWAESSTLRSMTNALGNVKDRICQLTDPCLNYDANHAVTMSVHFDITDRFSCPDRTIGRVCVCVCLCVF